MTKTEILAAPGTRPFPDPELTVRSAGDRHPETFFASGLRSIENNRNALASIGRDLEDYQDILDFGCGCGRMLTWLEPLAELGPKLFATDTDRDAVAWIREHLPFAEASVNEPLPPTSYADGQFDLIYNHSVFTHLDEVRQDAWLLELRRITRVGAHLLLTVHGEHAFARYETAMLDNGGDAAAEREAYSGHGLLFMPDQGWQEKGFSDWYGTTYHTTRYIFSHWTRWFRIKAYLPQGALGFQDLVVLERVNDGEHHGEYLRQPASVLRMIAAHTTGESAPVTGAQDENEAAHQNAEAARAEAQAAVERAQRLIASGPDRASRSRLGLLGTAWRLALSRLIANYSVHERQVDETLVEALRALTHR